MKLKVWVEIMTVQRWTEDEFEVPDEKWAAMTPAERDAYGGELFEDMRNEIANGGWEEINDES